MSVAAFLDIDRIKPLIRQMKQQNEDMSLQEDARYYLERMQSMEMKRKFLRRDLEKAEQALHGTNAKLLPNNTVITNYQAEKQRCEKALGDLASVIETCHREKAARENESVSIQKQIEEAKTRLDSCLKEMGELQNSDEAIELATMLSEALGQSDADSQKESEEKVKASIEHQRLEKKAQSDALAADIEALSRQIEPLQALIAKYEADLQKATAGKEALAEQIKGLDEKINSVISENQRLSGDSQTKEQIYAKKKQEWLDYEEKYKAYEAKYNALVKSKQS